MFPPTLLTGHGDDQIQGSGKRSSLTEWVLRQQWKRLYSVINTITRGKRELKLLPAVSL
jgi:hypothetical protein